MSSKKQTELDVRTVSVNALVPNEWNPNKMSEREYEAEIQSIKAFGFVDPITVRPHPSIDGKFEIVDGEHRCRAAREAGLENVPVTVLDIDEPTAKRLTIILNETRGMADRVDLGVLLADLEQTIGFDELVVGLPFTNENITNLIELGSVEIPDYKGGGDPGPGEGGEGGSGSEEDGWESVWMRVPLAVAAMWLEARAAIEAEAEVEPHDDEHVRNGLAFELLLADWQASR
jgi:hypothetical protein